MTGTAGLTTIETDAHGHRVVRAGRVERYRQRLHAERDDRSRPRFVDEGALDVRVRVELRAAERRAVRDRRRRRPRDERRRRQDGERHAARRHRQRGIGGREDDRQRVAAGVEPRPGRRRIDEGSRHTRRRVELRRSEARAVDDRGRRVPRHQRRQPCLIETPCRRLARRHRTRCRTCCHPRPASWPRTGSRRLPRR